MTAPAPATSPLRESAARAALAGRRWWLGVAGLAALAGAFRAPYVGRTLSPDEGGLLLVAAQWSPGSSLYGDFFVDRPPLLIAIFGLADALGGTVPLRLLGILAAMAVVVLAAVLARVAGVPPRPALLPALTAAVLVANPLFGTVVNAELLGLPFVLAGCVLVVAAARATGVRAATGWAVLGGVAGASGALVKQSLLDVFVLAAVLLLAHRRLRPLAGFAAGAAAVVVLSVGAAYLRGTDPGDLWVAVADFRSQVFGLVLASAPASTAHRLAGLVLALIGSGAPLLGVVLARRVRRPALAVPDLRAGAFVVIAAEIVVVLLGGSYWPHYLMGLVPGLVLLTAAAVQRPPDTARLLPATYALAVLSTVCVVGWVVVHPVNRTSEPPIAWLEQNARPGDTAVVAFGGANILRETGMRAVYPDLWSMPVRVHDPELTHLAELLDSPGRPTWVVVNGTSLRTWGVEATDANALLRRHYDKVARTGIWTIYRSVAR